MGYLSESLREMRFVPTGEESPVSEDGELWSKGHELVCDETGTVIDGDHHEPPEKSDNMETQNGKIIYRYYNSNRVRMPGGYVSTYMD